MNIKQRLEERRAINLRLAEEDAKHRCGICKRAVPESKRFIRWGDPKPYCSQACLDEATLENDSCA